MRRLYILLCLFLFPLLNLSAQTRSLSCKVIDQEFNPLYQVYIQYSDTSYASPVDKGARFIFTIPANIKSITFSNVGFEPLNIELTDTCDQLDIVLLFNWTYDFKTVKQINKLRKRQFDKLPELHLTAYRNGVFQNSAPCYKAIFLPFIPGKDKIPQKVDFY